MTFWQKVSLCLALSTVFLVSSCGGRQVLANDDPARLAEIARNYAEGGHLGGTPPAASAAKQQMPTASDIIADHEEFDYQSQMMMYLVRKDYDHLDQAERDARLNKARFRGGSWKLWDFYDGVSKPPTGDQATGDDWDGQIAALKDWVAAKPESAVARIALAEGYVNFGYYARGTGYADSVSDEGWRLCQQRVDMAASALVDAAKLKEKDPHWYSVMQDVALFQGWDKSQAKELLDAAIAFEPTYYHVYRQYVNFLLPKWYGEPGEAEAFAEQASDQIGGEQGKFIYFEMATTIACGCNSDDDNAVLQNLSWPKIKEGYAVMGQLYGYSPLKMNRFAYLAALERDKPAAEQVFAALGDNRDKSVWHSDLDFQNARAWAVGQ
jgi:hypothetical protein